MATYTTELRSLIEAEYDIFDRVRPFPIFDENYRDILEQKIIDHYYTREIGLETAGLFKHYLNTTLREIMPYYNKMYETEKIIFDPMVTFNLKETFTRTNGGTSNVTGTDIGSQVFSDTPQGKLSGLDYATNVTESDDTNNQTSTVTANENYERNTVGNTGATSDSRLIMDFRKSFLKIDLDIIRELKDLFFNLY